jgi:2-keto-4-pentenoate hydratase
MRTGKWEKISLVTLLFLIVLIGAGFLSASAADPGTELAAQFVAKKPVTAIDPAMTLKEAADAQEKFIGVVAKDLGRPVGYKAGLTSPNAQKAFGVSQPVRGTMFEKMILTSGAVIPADFGTFPFGEGDLIVRVADEAINQAKTPGETLQWLDAVIPFIELPDMVFDKSVKLTAAAIVAINVGARFGVMGEPIPLAATPEWRDRLKDFSLQAFDEKNGVVGEGKGAALLDDPLNVVLWLKDSLAAEGKKLKKGELLSLGSLTRPIPAKPGGLIRARYTGLDPKGPVEISVTFK